MRGDKLNAIVWRDDPFWGHVRHRWKEKNLHTLKSCRSCGDMIREKPGEIKNYCNRCEDKCRRQGYGKMAHVQPR